MTPAEQAAREIVERWECGCCPECEKKLCEHSIGYIARAIEQVDAQWKNTLAEMEACYLKREGDIHARIEQAREEERAVMKRARDLLRDFFGEVGLREEDAFAHLAHDLLSARAQESEG